ncbi:MAG: ParA family protein [Spirochaetia bacterium]|nr:ParA family protein [Spirochaetia bacterium]
MKAVIAVANSKGGVGKTTTAVHIADSLSRKNKVLLIDVDVQANASSIFLEGDLPLERTVYAALKEKRPLAQLVHETRNANLDVIPATIHLAEIDSLISGAIDGFFRLSEAMTAQPLPHEFVIIDCPPNLGMITVNAFVASTHVIVPLQTAKFSLDGLAALSSTLKAVQGRYNTKLRILGGVLTMYNPRTAITHAMIEPIQEYISIFETKISRLVAVEEAFLMKQTVFEYEPSNRVAQEYLALTEEVLRGIEKG